MRLQAGDDTRSDRVIVIYKHEINRLGGNLLFARRGDTRPSAREHRLYMVLRQNKAEPTAFLTSPSAF